MNRLSNFMVRLFPKASLIRTIELDKSHTRSFVRKLSDNTKHAAKSTGQLVRALPPALYSDASAYQMERENVFGKNWIYAGPFDRLRKLGDYLSITIAGYPIFVYRNPLTSELVAFHNVCSHRAGPIVPINLQHHGGALYGNQPLLKCQYHAWLYDPRDGTLKATPNFNYQFTPNEKKCMKLKRINVEVFAQQFVFVNMNDTSEIPSINTLLVDLKDDMMAFPLNEYEYLESQTHMLNCNWKTYVDNYQEGYHVHSIHPELDRAVQAKQYTVTNRNDLYSIHHVPSRPSNNQQEKYLWLYLYPNLALNLYERSYSIEHILPVGKDRTLICYEFFVRSAANAEEMAKHVAEAKDCIRSTLAITNEDKMICEQTQTNLDSGVYKPGYLSPAMECGVQFFQSRLRRELQSTHLQLN